MPDTSPIEQLTARERDCLRQAWLTPETKNIAAALGISAFTVKQHIGAAMRTLSVSNRREAAEMLALHEGRVTPTAGTSLPRGMVSDSTSGTLGQPDEAIEQEAPAGAVREEKLTFQAVDQASSLIKLLEWHLWSSNQLSRGQKLALMFAVALFAMAITAIFVGALHEADELHRPRTHAGQ